MTDIVLQRKLTERRCKGAFREPPSTFVCYYYSLRDYNLVKKGCFMDLIIIIQDIGKGTIIKNGKHIRSTRNRCDKINELYWKTE